jgi:hypothetical protein
MIEFDPRFSYNLVRTPPWFPDKKQKVGVAEQSILDSRGRPDFMRIWWRPDGELISSRDLAGLPPEQVAERLATSDKSWIYSRDNEEVIFLRAGASYRTHPLSEKTKLVCTYGDPSNISPPVVRDGQTHETWQWIEHGLQIEFVDGAELNRTHFKATGAGTYLLK